VDVPVEIEIVEPPPKVEPRPPPPPPPRPEPEPAPEPEPPPRPKIQPKQASKPRVATPRVPPAPVEPAPGPSTNSDVPAPVIKLPDLGVGGSGPPAAVGRPTSRKVGTGGTGTNTGGGGKADSTGTGGPPPVSVSAIKTLARPLNADLDASKEYPEAAKRAGIEGKVKVRLTVDATGNVTKRRLITRLGHGLDELALKLALRLRFEPARDTNDRPVPSTVVWTFSFLLPR